MTPRQKLMDAAVARQMSVKFAFGEFRVAYRLDHYTPHCASRAKALERMEDQAAYETDAESALDTLTAMANARDAAKAAYPEGASESPAQ